MLLRWAIVLTDLLVIRVASELTAVVNTTYGPVQGEICTTINSMNYSLFMGIPFAKPPVGNLRFKPPVPPDPWTEVLNATTAPDACIYWDSGSKSTIGSEDCLYISVFTPKVIKSGHEQSTTDNKSLAVIFWIYGGAFLHGSSITPDERPDMLLEKGIVFVALNHRPGLFGYLNLGHPNATGNAGLKDLVLGLKWVQANIDKFGGNPNNVTLFGGSSGGAAVQYLVLSDITAGLFHGAISMSGTPLATWASQSSSKALSQVQKLAGFMDIPWTDVETVLTALYEASAEDIVIATSHLGQHFGPFTPTVEDATITTEYFLSECIASRYKNGKFNKVRHLMGASAQETVTFVGDKQQVYELIEQTFNGAKDSNLTIPPHILSTIDKMTISTESHEYVTYPELRKFINYTSDLVYKVPVDQTRNFLSVINGSDSIFYYRLSYFLPGVHAFAPNNSLPGAGHGDEIPFLFYMPQFDFDNFPGALQLRDYMTTMWTNFAKYGNPTPDWVDDNPLNFTWPESGSKGLSLDIDYQFTVIPTLIMKSGKRLEKQIRQYQEAKKC